VSSKIEFKILPHKIDSKTDVVEIRLNGKFCACIYPDEVNNGIKLVSAHFAGEVTKENKFPEGVKMDTGERNPPPIPCVKFSFHHRKYRLQSDGIVRLPD